MNQGCKVMAPLAGVPERADRKQCTPGTPEAETERTERFKEMFKKYDCMQ